MFFICFFKNKLGRIRLLYLVRNKIAFGWIQSDQLEYQCYYQLSQASEKDKLMKIWIVRLNGKIITQYSRTPNTEETQVSQPEEKKQEKRSWFSLVSWNSSCNPEEEKKEEEEYIKRCILLEVIEHSRKLPLAEYNNELNYTRVRGRNYYYLARHKLLFIFCEQEDNLSILAIQSILFKTVNLYKAKCLHVLHNGYQLPNRLNNYQLTELQRLSDDINSIIQQEDQFQFVRKESIREGIDINATVQQVELRKQNLDKILNQQRKYEQKSVKIDYEIDKKVNKYRTKLYFLCLLAVIVGSVTLYFIAFGDFTNQL